MLVLSRKMDESIVIDGNIRVTVVGIRGNQVRIGIEAPGSVKIFRSELLAAPKSSDADAVAPELDIETPDTGDCPHDDHAAGCLSVAKV